MYVARSYYIAASRCIQLSITGEAELAIAASDGSVSLMTVRQLAVSARSWRPAARPPKVIDAGDGRGVTALTWIKVGRAGSAKWRMADGEGHTRVDEAWIGASVVR